MTMSVHPRIYRRRKRESSVKDGGIFVQRMLRALKREENREKRKPSKGTKVGDKRRAGMRFEVGF